MADGYRITVLGKGREFTCNHDQDVLAAAVAQGVRSIKRGCRGGGCGLCKVRVVEGSYELGKTSVAVLPGMKGNGVCSDVQDHPQVGSGHPFDRRLMRRGGSEWRFSPKPSNRFGNSPGIG